MCRHPHNKPAFTLVELLVVIAVLALLMTIIVPAMARVKERARRVVCQANMRSFYTCTVGFSVNNDGFLPPGQEPFTIIMNKHLYDSLTDQAPGSLACPNLLRPFRGGNANIFDQGNYISDNDSILLGYNYLGGFSGTPWPLITPAQTRWISPLRATDPSGLTLFAELNTWITETYRMTFSPHGYAGPIHESGDSTNASHNGSPSDQLGAVGGHLCRLDGAIQWKDIDEMTIHMASNYPSIDLFALW